MKASFIFRPPSLPVKETMPEEPSLGDYEVELLTKRTALSIEKMGLQQRMEELNGQVRGKRLSRQHYMELLAEQNDLRVKLLQGDQKLLAMKAELHEINIRKDEAKRKLPAPAGPDVAALVTLLDSLARKYQQHAQDATRVSSTRIMASKFAEEIREIIRSGA